MDVSALNSLAALGPSRGPLSTGQVEVDAGGPVALPDLGPGYLYLTASADNAGVVTLHGDTDGDGDPDADGYPLAAGTPIGPLYTRSSAELHAAGDNAGDVLHYLHVATAQPGDA